MASRSDNQRRDSLSFLTTAIVRRPVETPLQLPISVIISKLLPLILDSNHGVRIQLLKLLHTLPSENVKDYIDQILLYIRVGMTHLASDINSSAMDILSWGLDQAGQELVSCAGGWFKTLKCFLAVFGWSRQENSTSWSSSKTSLGKVGTETKSLTKSLNTLTSFLRTGLIDLPTEVPHDEWTCTFPLQHVSVHMLPKTSNCFVHLNLFGPSRDEESEMHEDQDDRKRVFHKSFESTIQNGLDVIQREGGEVGRAAAGVKKVMVEGMNGHDAKEVRDCV